MKKIKLSGRVDGLFVWVDDIDFDYLSQFSWNSTPKGYQIRTDRSDGKKTIYLHREVAQRMGLNAEQIDHIDGDKLDCRRSNLREATNQLNQANVGIQINNTTGFKGVSKRTKNGYTRFVARIGVGYKRIHLGSFSTAEAAHAAYESAALKYFGEFARS